MLLTFDYTMGTVLYYTGANVNVIPDQVDSLSDRDIEILELGSKVEFMTWFTYPTYICMPPEENNGHAHREEPRVQCQTTTQAARSHADNMPLTGVLKFSILIFYKRLKMDAARNKWVLRVLFAFCFMTWSGLLLSIVLSCRP